MARGKRGGPGRWRASASAKAARLAARACSSDARLALGRWNARQGLCPLPWAVQKAGQMGTFLRETNLESVVIPIAGLCGWDSGSGRGSG